MTNWIVCPVRNNLYLTKKAVKTFRAQDIGNIEICIVNNGSTDGTTEWLTAQRDLIHTYADPPASVAASWNSSLRVIFGTGALYALVVNNDVELRPDTYRRLVEDGGGFVTAVGSRDPDCVLPTEEALPEYMQYEPPNPERKRPHPDFSCYLIRKEVYEKVGPFDENFLIAFGEDWDYHVRLHKAGITAYCIDLPFLHHGSMTIKNADMSEVRKIQMQAEKNREYFKKKWGMAGASEEYYRFFNSTPPPKGDWE